MDSDGNRGSTREEGKKGRKRAGNIRAPVAQKGWSGLKEEAARQRKKGYEKRRGDDGKR